MIRPACTDDGVLHGMARVLILEGEEREKIGRSLCGRQGMAVGRRAVGGQETRRDWQEVGSWFNRPCLPAGNLQPLLSSLTGCRQESNAVLATGVLFCSLVPTWHWIQQEH